MKPNKYLDDVLSEQLKSSEELEKEELLQKKIDLLSEYMKLEPDNVLISNEISKLRDLLRGINQPPQDFALEETSYFYVFKNVLVDGINYDISWTKNLLAKGKTKTQDEWMEYCRTQKEYRGQIITLPSGLVYHSCTSVLYRNRTNSNLNKNLIEKVKNMFSEDFEKYWMTTSTRIRYKVRPVLDEVVHDYKSNQSIIKPVNLQGSDGSISTLGCADEMDAIFGSRNLSEINAVYEWITGNDTYLRRLDGVTTNEERPLGVGVGIFGVDAGNRFVGLRCARGVAVGRA